MKRIYFHKIFIITVVFVQLILACAGDNVMQDGRQNSADISVRGTMFSGEPHNSVTRTSLSEHTKGGEAQVVWTSGDNIWVKDDNGIFYQSSNVTFPYADNKAYANFNLTAGDFTGTTHQVMYTGTNSTSATMVEIMATQTQAVTNSFSHLGESGDCGIATATKKGGFYKFTLEHKAAYLCVYPRIENKLLHKNVKIDKIVITSTSGPIAGGYDFSTGSLTPISPISNSITLITTSGEIASATRNDTCYYVVIAPGIHTLKVDYYIQDLTTNVSKTISRDLGIISCDEGKITEISVWIDKELVDFNSFYMWDAEKPYWYGFESVQPFTNGENNPNYPQPGDNRYFNRPVYPSTEGSHNPLFMSTSVRHVPNMNEMSWYLKKGNPTWDANGVYVFRGHLQQGRGVWIKKMSKIIVDNASDVAAAGGDVKEMGVDGVWYGPYNDYRTRWVWFTVIPSSTPLTVDEQADYFFLPFTVGSYSNGTYYLDYNTYYWTSTWNTDGFLYHLNEGFGGLTIYYVSGVSGAVAVPFF